MHCHSCGSENPSFHSFCYQCGTALSQQNSLAVTPPSPKPSQVNLQPELKKASILFVDITNSVHLIHKLNPEESADYLDPTITNLKLCAHRFGGMINRVDGDGMMVIFGAPTAYEDHATRACFAALDMLKAVKEEYKSSQIGVRIGVHSGEVLMKPFYNDFSVDYEALGPTVYLAHRMEMLASPNTAIISKDTYVLAHKSINTLDLGPTAVKGLDDEVPIYQLLNRKDQQTHREKAAIATPFIGRHNELLRMTQMIYPTATGTGKAIALCAEAGIGKTRLISAFLNQLDSDQFQIIESGCDSHNQNNSYLPFSNILRFWLNVQDTDKQLDIAQKLRDRVFRLNESIAQHLSAFHFLLDLPIHNKNWAQLDPTQKRQHVRKAIHALITELGKRKPLILLIEDLHWVDNDSQTLLNELAGFVSDYPVTLITTFRPEYHVPEFEIQCQRIELKPFTLIESENYLQELLGSNPQINDLFEKINGRCEGNPLYIEEMVKHLLDSQIIREDNGQFSTTTKLLPQTLPITIESVISTRIDRRSRLAKTLLQAASVIGQRFSATLLDCITDAPLNYAKNGIKELIDCGLIIPSGDSIYDEYQFKHALVHQVAYDSITRECKKHMHANLVDAIETVHKERLDENIYRLAQHAFLGQLWHKAADYFLKTCQHAIGRSSHVQAVTMMDMGLESLNHLPVNPHTLGQRVDFLTVGMNALIPLGEQDRLVRNLHEAEQLCQELKEPKRMCSILCQLSNSLWMVGKHNEAFQAANRALALAQTLDHPPLYIAAQYNLAMVYHAMAEFETCIELAEKILAALSGELEFNRMGWSGYPSVFTRTFYGNSLVELGRLDEAETVILEGIKIANETEHPYSQAMIYDTYGYYLLMTNNYDKAEQVLTEALSKCDEYAVLTMKPAIIAKLGMALLNNGQTSKAETLLTYAAHPNCYRKGGRYTWYYLFNTLAHLYMATEGLDKAIIFAQKAFTLTSETGEKAHHGWACLTMTKVLISCKHSIPLQAEQLIERALNIANSKKMPLLAFNTTALALELSQQSGDKKNQILYKEMSLQYAASIKHDYFLKYSC